MSRPSAMLIAGIAGCALLTPAPSHAQWWSVRAPVDFEECADRADKSATKEARTAALSECHSKFAGRRKIGGGYTYFDFMQNRHFDIAGPNPTPEEQKNIDEQYTVYLDGQRRSTIASALMAKQQQQQQQKQQQQQTPQQPAPQRIQQASLKPEAEKTPIPREKPSAATTDLRSRTRATNCTKPHTFSCDWPRLSDGINDLKKALFGSSQSKPAKRS